MQQTWRDLQTRLLTKRTAIAGLVIAAGLVSGLVLGRDRQPPVETVAVVRGDIQKTVTAVGALQPKSYVDVGTQVSGRVEKIHVEIGRDVKAGDLIAEIDPKVYQSTVRKDQANLEQLKAQLSQQIAERNLAQEQSERNKRMLDSHAVSQSAADEAEATFKVTDAAVASTSAQIKAAEATLEGSRTNLSYTKVYSPIAGTIVSQSTLEGQTVNAVQSAPVIVQVANLDVMTVWAQVAEADVPKIRAGTSAYFTTLGAPDERWKGVVRQVQPTPETVNDVVLYNVLVDVQNADHKLLPQMTVQVFFVLDEASDVPVVPLNALHAIDQTKGIYRADVLVDSGVESRQVTVGLSNRSQAQVRSGLAVGDRIVVSPADSDGPEARPPQRPSQAPRLGAP